MHINVQSHQKSEATAAQHQSREHRKICEKSLQAAKVLCNFLDIYKYAPYLTGALTKFQTRPQTGGEQIKNDVSRKAICLIM